MAVKDNSGEFTADELHWLEQIRKELFWRMDMASTTKAGMNANLRICAFDKWWQ
jgi:hypothetical protein